MAGTCSMTAGLVFAGQGVVAGIGDRTDAAAGIFELDHVGADALNGFEDILLAGEANSHDQDEGGRADDHAQRSEREAHFAGAKAIEREHDDLAEHHGPLGTVQGLSGTSAGDGGGAALGSGSRGRSPVLVDGSVPYDQGHNFSAIGSGPYAQAIS